MIGILCRSEDHKSKIEEVVNKIGVEAFDLLMQARGWAARWTNDEDISNEITRTFMERIDALLCLTDIPRDDEPVPSNETSLSLGDILISPDGTIEMKINLNAFRIKRREVTTLQWNGRNVDEVEASFHEWAQRIHDFFYQLDSIIH